MTEAQELKSLNTLWVGDITYTPKGEIRFGYLALLMDRFSRRMVGWKLSDDMAKPLIISSGGNSGSQAATRIVRAFALGEVRLRD